MSASAAGARDAFAVAARTSRASFDEFVSQLPLILHQNLHLADSDGLFSVALTHPPTPTCTHSAVFQQPASGAIGKAECAGVRARFRYCIHGHALRASLYPPVTVLYRRARWGTTRKMVTPQRLMVNGAVTEIAAPIAHDDSKPLPRGSLRRTVIPRWV